MPGNLVLLDLDLQNGQTGEGFHVHVVVATNATQDIFNLLSFGLEGRDVVAKYLDGQVGACAGGHFVYTQLDRLREGEVLSEEGLNLLFDQFREFCLSLCHFPFVARLQTDEHVR